MCVYHYNPLSGLYRSVLRDVLCRAIVRLLFKSPNMALWYVGCPAVMVGILLNRCYSRKNRGPADENRSDIEICCKDRVRFCSFMRNRGSAYNHLEKEGDELQTANRLIGHGPSFKIHSETLRQRIDFLFRALRGRQVGDTVDR